MIHRPRRLRKTAISREMVAETRLSKDMFIYPYFVVEGTNTIHPIDAMPGINHYSIDELLKDVEKGVDIRRTSKDQNICFRKMNVFS